MRLLNLRDVVMAYLNENENRAVVESISRLSMSNEPVLMEVKERPQTAAVVQSITADIIFSVATPTMAPSIKMRASAERRPRKSDGEDGTLSIQRPERFVEGSGDDGDDTVVDVESDAAIWCEVLNSEMPDYLGEDTSLLDHECFSGDSHHDSNHLPLSTFIVLWEAFTEWQPLEMEDSSSTKRMDSAGGLSTSKQRAEVWVTATSASFLIITLSFDLVHCPQFFWCYF